MQAVFRVLPVISLCISAAAIAEIRPVATTRKVNVDVSTALTVAKRMLAAKGFQITYSDEAAGIVSTAPKPTHVSIFEGKCGEDWEKNYIGDARTTVSAAYNVLVADGAVTVTATYTGTFSPYRDEPGQPIPCKSYGYAELEILNEISKSAAAGPP